ncbi:hypothetical protein [Achromobacter sp.]|uniref:hypothetical protein n=1 Tax=Achromobacter sp. TaxID=134375 RepID=UPI00338F8B1D
MSSWPSPPSASRGKTGAAKWPPGTKLRLVTRNLGASIAMQCWNTARGCTAMSFRRSGSTKPTRIWPVLSRTRGFR